MSMVKPKPSAETHTSRDPAPSFTRYAASAKPTEARTDNRCHVTIISSVCKDTLKEDKPPYKGGTGY
jgi:hypothetical protein